MTNFSSDFSTFSINARSGNKRLQSLKRISFWANSALNASSGFFSAQASPVTKSIKMFVSTTNG
jgi:hypothetical protein